MSNYRKLKWALLLVSALCALTLLVTGVYWKASLSEQQKVVQQRQDNLLHLELLAQEENDNTSEVITQYSVATMVQLQESVAAYLNSAGYTYDSLTTYPLSADDSCTYLIVLEQFDAFSIPRQLAITCTLNSSGVISDFEQYTIVP